MTQHDFTCNIQTLLPLRDFRNNHALVEVGADTNRRVKNSGSPIATGDFQGSVTSAE
jgi:hypothetical protein